MGIQRVWIITILGKKNSIAMGGFWIDGVLGTSNIVRRIIDTEDVVGVHPVVFEEQTIYTGRDTQGQLSRY